MTHPDPVLAETSLPHCGIVPPNPYQPLSSEDLLRLQAAWPSGERLKTAWRLAKDLDTLEQLLAGQPVDPARIDQDELQRALEPRLVQLVRPIDVLHGKAAA